MDPRLREYLKKLLDRAIHSAIGSLFFKMPWQIVLLLLVIMIGIVIYFGLY